MAQPRDSRGRFASNGLGWVGAAGVALVIATGSGSGAGAGVGALGSASAADASAARAAARRGVSSRSIVRSVKPVVRVGRLALRLHDAQVRLNLHAGRRRVTLRIPLTVTNEGPTTVVLRAHDQVLVTYDRRKDSQPEQAPAVDATWSLRPLRATPVTLTFVLPVAEAPAQMRLRAGGVTTLVPLRVR